MMKPLFSLSGELLQGWQQQRTNNGVPYYTSCEHKSSQWYHPEYVQVIQQVIQRFRDTRYTAYRTAQKLTLLRDILNVGGVTLQSLVAAFASVGLSSNDSNDDVVTVGVVEAVLEQLYGLQNWSTVDNSSRSATLDKISSELSHAKNCPNIEPTATLAMASGPHKSKLTISNSETSVKLDKNGSIENSSKKETCKAVQIEMIVNLLLNLFDQSREGLLPVLGFKLLLLVLCAANTALQQKHSYLHTQLADYTSAVPRSSTRRALLLLSRMPELLGEELWFGRHLVGGAIQGGYTSQGTSSVGLSQREFLLWLQREPQTLVWWSTLYRMTYAANVLQCGSVCSVCSTASVRGLLYSCLVCSYIACQNCFLLATPHPTAPHNPAHALQEHCTQITLKQRSRDALCRLGERLKGSSGKEVQRQRYLPITSVGSPEPPSSPTSRPPDGLLSRTVALHPGGEGEEASLHIQPSGDEREHGVAAGRNAQCVPSDGFKVSLTPLPNTNYSDSKIRELTSGQNGNKNTVNKCSGFGQYDLGNSDHPNRDSKGSAITHNNKKRGQCKHEMFKEPRKKNKFMNIFKSTKDKRDGKKIVSDNNKENIEMFAEATDEDDAVGCGFSRYNPRSQSFGANRVPSKTVPGQQRFGSCRMNQVVRVNSGGSGHYKSVGLGSSGSNKGIGSCGGNKDNTRAGSGAKVSPKVAALSCSDSMRRMRHQNNSNQLINNNKRNSSPSADGSSPSSPRRQLDTILRQLQDGHDALSNASFRGPSSAALVQQHAAQLQQHIHALKHLKQTLNGPVGVVPPRPRSFLPPHLRLAGFESSTPVTTAAGGGITITPAAAPRQPPTVSSSLGQRLPTEEVGSTDMNSRSKRQTSWASLSPITKHSSQTNTTTTPILSPLDDTAVLDNKDNHRVEQPPAEVFRHTADAKRAAYSNTNERNNPSMIMSIPSPTERSRLPSFTEVNFSDLTNLSGATARSADRYSDQCDDVLSSYGGGNDTFVGVNATVVSPEKSGYSWSAHTIVNTTPIVTETNRGSVTRNTASIGTTIGVTSDSVVASDSGGGVGVASGSGEGDVLDTSVIELQCELEEILQQLDAMFPAGTRTKQTKDCDAAVCAAQEMGDCLAQYVDTAAQ